ncbi:MAG: hypothetical protein IPN69_02580 [Acidobacteria bacterium]|nr:hypothetical protein [Acidobacteriota bacterium]MBK8809600.1 hypothetical protein [Acidobacteriota bacterium]
MSDSNYQAPAELNRYRSIALGAGILAVVVLAVMITSPDSREQALRSWLLGFTFWGGIAIGSLGVLMLQYVTGGAWAVVIRRTVEAGSRTLPLVAILFIPILAYVGSLYEWSHMHGTDRIVTSRGWYLTWGGFAGRTVAYFAIFIVMQWLLNKWSLAQDKTENYEDSAKLLGTSTAFSGPGIVVFALVVSFAAIDWTMTLDPHWFSTIWGFLYIAGWALSCFCFAVVILAYLSDKEPMNRVIGKRHFHDIGKLMLALVMVWTYFNLSQFLIIWSGNIPEETPWYLKRMKDGWGVVGLVLILFHFAFPFIILLSRDLKRNAKWLAIMAVFILAMRSVDMFYHIAPSPTVGGGHGGSGFHVSWMDFAAVIGIGGIWVAYFFTQLMKRPLVPIMDPFLENAIDHGKGH